VALSGYRSPTTIGTLSLRQVMFATAGAVLYKTTLPNLDAELFGQDLRSMVGRIVRGAVHDGAGAGSTQKQLKVADTKARRSESVAARGDCVDFLVRIDEGRRRTARDRKSQRGSHT
jgi:hypothetical protein